jgi:hypothetical protein
MVGMKENAFFNVKNRSHSITAEVERHHPLAVARLRPTAKSADNRLLARVRRKRDAVIDACWVAKKPANFPLYSY